MHAYDPNVRPTRGVTSIDSLMALQPQASEKPVMRSIDDGEYMVMIVYDDGKYCRWHPPINIPFPELPIPASTFLFAVRGALPPLSPFYLC